MDIDQLCRVVRTAADLKKLPGYVAKINPAHIGLQRVIWTYEFPTEIQCALTNCGTHHKVGVVIELEDGTVSNIGNICGADEDKFSSKFTAEMRKLSDSRRREEMLPPLLNRSALEDTERLVRSAYHEAEQWVRRVATFALACPEADRELRRRVSSGASLAVTEIVERTASEISDLIASGLARNRKDARYKEIEKGVVRGSGALSLTEQRVSSLWRRADALLAADPQALDISELQKLYNESVYLPEDARNVLEECAAARLFFTKENFALIASLPMSQGGLDVLNSLTLDKLDSSRSKPLAHSSAQDSTETWPISKKQRNRKRKTDALLRAAQRIAKR